MDINLLPRGYNPQTSRFPVYLGGGLLVLTLLFAGIDVWNGLNLSSLSQRIAADKSTYNQVVKQDASVRAKIHGTSPGQQKSGQSVSLQQTIAELMTAESSVSLKHVVFKQPDTISGTGTASSLNALAAYQTKVSAQKDIQSIWISDVTKVSGGKYSFSMTVRASSGGAS